MYESPEPSTSVGVAPDLPPPLRKRFAAAAVSAMGVSALVLGLAFVRQMLIAAFFGISRALDIYLMVYTIAAMTVFVFGFIFDAAAVPRLVQVRENKGEKAARALSAGIFRLSCIIGLAASAIMLAATPLLIPVIATGFQPNEKSELSRLVYYFLPWTLLCVPYYAAAARQKGIRNFNRVFAAEVVICVVSIGVLLFWHSRIAYLPLAYAAGYGAGLLTLLPGSGVLSLAPGGSVLRTVLRNTGEQFLVNQTSSLSNVADRHFQSLIPMGGIAAVNYATQAVNALATLVTFREIFIVPLAETTRRTEKLERLVIGMLLLAVPVAVFTSLFSHEVVSVLFRRGNFDAGAVDVTSSVLRISALALVSSVINTPFLRMFQIIDRINLTHFVNLWSVVVISGFGYLFIGLLGLGAPGVAWMQLMNGVFTGIASVWIVARAGIVVRWWRIAGFVAFALGTSGIAAVAARMVVSLLTDAGAWVELLCAGLIYCLVWGACYFAAQTKLKPIFS